MTPANVAALLLGTEAARSPSVRPVAGAMWKLANGETWTARLSQGHTDRPVGDTGGTRRRNGDQAGATAIGGPRRGDSTVTAADLFRTNHPS
jgi:hypothetical protein